jgi:Uncharacterised protein family (UPF0184)
MIKLQIVWQINFSDFQIAGNGNNMYCMIAFVNTSLASIFCQDQIERKNDDIHDQLKELLEFSKQTRQMMAAENEANLSKDLQNL